MSNILVSGDALCFVLSPTRTKEAVDKVLNSFLQGYQKIDGDYAFNLTTDQTFDNEENLLQYLENVKWERGTIHWRKDQDNPDQIMVGAYFTSDGKLILSLTVSANGKTEEKYFEQLKNVVGSGIGVVSYNQFPEFENGEDFKSRYS